MHPLRRYAWLRANRGLATTVTLGRLETSTPCVLVGHGLYEWTWRVEIDGDVVDVDRTRIRVVPTLVPRSPAT